MGGKAWVWSKQNGTFIVRYRDDGGRTRSLGTFKDRDEADRVRERYDLMNADTVARNADMRRAMLDFGGVVYWDDDGGKRVTLARYLRDWIESDRSIGNETRRRYLQHVRDYIDRSDLGRTSLRRITPRIIEDYWNRLDAGHGTRTEVYKVLSKGFRRAVRLGDAQMNPLDRTDLKRPASRVRRIKGIIDRDHLEPLADAALSQRDRLAILLQGWVGLRPGEVGALTVKGFHTKTCELEVRQSVKRHPGGPVVGPLKGGRPSRTVVLPRSLCKELGAYVKRLPRDEEMLFRADQGGLWYRLR